MSKKRQRECIVLVTGSVIILIMCICSNIFSGRNKNKVYANQNIVETSANSEEHNMNEEAYEVRSSLLDIVEGINSVANYCSRLSSAKTKYNVDDILVGEFVSSQESADKVIYLNDLRVSSTSIEQSALSFIASNRTSDKDYDALLRIVEAEATGEGYKGKVLIANVILNRVNDARFPNNAYDVVWEKMNGISQFAPTVDGRIETVTISDETREAVNSAINGEDYSEGALFFTVRADANADDMKWFDAALTSLFTYGNHEFYKIAE